MPAVPCVCDLTGLMSHDSLSDGSTSRQGAPLRCGQSRVFERPDICRYSEEGCLVTPLHDLLVNRPDINRLLPHEPSQTFQPGIDFNLRPPCRAGWTMRRQYHETRQPRAHAVSALQGGV